MSAKCGAGSFIYWYDVCIQHYEDLLFFLSPLSEKMWTLWQVSSCILDGKSQAHTAFNSLTWRFGNTAAAECSRGSSCWWCCDSAHQRVGTTAATALQRETGKSTFAGYLISISGFIFSPSKACPNVSDALTVMLTYSRTQLTLSAIIYLALIYSFIQLSMQCLL